MMPRPDKPFDRAGPEEEFAWWPTILRSGNIVWLRKVLYIYNIYDFGSTVLKEYYVPEDIAVMKLKGIL